MSPSYTLREEIDMASPPKYPNFSFATDPEIRKLQEFLLELRDIMDGGVTHPRPAIAGRHHAKLQAAWKDAYPRFESFATEPK